jgi:AraC family transcriptional regulator
MQASLGPGSYYGQTQQCSEIAGLILTESAYPPDTDIPPHGHENAFFYLVVQGTCREVRGGEEIVAEPSALVFHPAQEPHANRWVGTEGRCFHVEFSPAWMQRLNGQGLTLERPMQHQGGLPAWLATRLYHEFHRSDTASRLAIEGLTLELLAELVRSPQKSVASLPPRWLEQARDLLDAHFAENLSVETVARTVDVHPAHLVRSFRRQYGCTMGDYVRQRRIEFACRALSTADTSLADIALTAGFSDQSHFCKTFKRLTGFTPAQYQRQVRLR